MREKPEGATRLILVRHGEPAEEARGRCYGRLDVGLAPAGRLQAQAAADSLSSVALDAVYASPRRRAIESARPIADPRGLEVVLSDALREIDFGLFEGMTYDEARLRYPDIYAVWMERPTEVEFPGGESFTTMRHRVLGVFHEIRERHAAQTVAVVSHGGTNRVLLAEALGMADEFVFRFDQGFSCVNVVDYYGDTPVVRLLNAPFD